MLTDSPPDLDRRVLQAWQEYGEPALLVIPRRTSRAWRYASLGLAIASLPVLWMRFGLPLRRLGARMQGGYGGVLSGLRAFVLLQAAALAFFWSRRRRLRDADFVYAHDQMAGAVAWIARRAYGVPYIYDAHEIVPFRARQTGPARMLLEFGWERAIVHASRHCCVVNRPMRRFYRHLYGAAEYRIRPNDFFPDRDLFIDPTGPRLIVYVGALGKHRGLERMAALGAAHGAGLLCFCSNAGLAGGGPAGAELHGLEDYESVLLRRAAGAAPYFWCAFDTDVLSYRYSLPNKFFQAMALGVPIVAARASYLGRLVRRHGLGVVTGTDGVAAPDPWSPEVYARCAHAMTAFRTAYRRGEVTI